MKTKQAIIFVTFTCALALGSSFGITPNKLVSAGLPAHAGGSTTDYLTDGFLTNWKSSSAKDIAINVGEGPVKLRINWESFGDCAWATNFTTGCSHSGTPLSNFKIMTSANSTNGLDGDWSEAAKVSNNPVMARGVDIDFAGKSWFRIVSDGNVGQILEIEAFDMTNGGTDTWFFMGTSISQMGIKQQDTDSTTAQIIHAKFPEYTPAMLRGGIGCINSTEVVEHLKDYLAYAGNVKYWAIEMGTNDAWGGSDGNLQTFTKNMQTIIDSAKAHNITPILARIIATNPAKSEKGWQVNPKFLEAIDKLTVDNNLPTGPDFYTYFSKHPELLGDDGVHPNASTGGGKAMHRLWAEALMPLYEAERPTSSSELSNSSSSSSSCSSCKSSSSSDLNEYNGESQGDSATTAFGNKARRASDFMIPKVSVRDRNVLVTGLSEVQVDIVSPLGQVLESHKNTQFRANVPAGHYLAVIRGKGTASTARITIK